MKDRTGEFTENKITDYKRVARGEHILAARGILRARDHIHNGKWKVLTLAGPCPIEEISAIKSVMPTAKIVAVDTDQDRVQKALSAGADLSLNLDLDYRAEYNNRRSRHPQLAKEYPMDCVFLDFCGVVSPLLRDLVWIYAPAKGAMVVTFSYGHDVVEAFQARRKEIGKEMWEAIRARNPLVPEILLERIVFLTGYSASRTVDRHGEKGDAARHVDMLWLSGLVSIIAYTNKMPMVSLLFDLHKDHNYPISFVKLTPGDFEIMAAHQDSVDLYACPQERIESLRRSHAAIKASYTRHKPK